MFSNGCCTAPRAKHIYFVKQNKKDVDWKMRCVFDLPFFDRFLCVFCLLFFVFIIIICVFFFLFSSIVFVCCCYIGLHPLVVFFIISHLILISPLLLDSFNKIPYNVIFMFGRFFFLFLFLLLRPVRLAGNVENQ